MSEVGLPLFVTCAKGLEDLLQAELQALGINQLQRHVGGLACLANQRQSLQVCLWSRVANRVLLQLSRFSAATDSQLYDTLVKFPWAEHMDVTQHFAVDCKLNKSSLQHSQYAALKAKDAIVDAFRRSTGQRPNVQTRQPDLQFSLYILKDQATLYLDLSGESLHKRGYRVAGERAPLKETLAAALLYRCKWPERAAQKQALVDPMCGSGTLLIEAALMASHTAPGLYRSYYGFLGWKKFDLALWDALKTEAQHQQQQDAIPSITGYDHEKHAIYASRQNIQAAGLEKYIHIERRDISQASPRHSNDRGIIIVNPPYGERIGELARLRQLYRQMGERFQQAFLHWDAFVFTNDMELGKAIPLRAYKSNAFYNGPIACKLLHFHIEPQWFFEASEGFRYIPADKREPQAEMFANRLQKNLKHLRKWAKRESVDCYRVYDADIPEFALAIDIYHADRLLIHAQEYEAPKDIPEKLAKRRLNNALSIIQDVFSVTKQQIFVKTRKQQKGLAQYQAQDQKPEYHVVRENGLKFQVCLNQYLDSGLFLDHRKTRQLIADMAQGKSFLNLFCYTATVSVYAASGGASSTTSVDMSRTYLDWAGRNFALNHLDSKRNRRIQADCLQWLEQNDERFDLIFLDPPSFSNSKRMKQHFSVQSDHVALIQRTMQHLQAGGTLIFSNNYRRFKMSTEILENFRVEDITPRTIPEDFKRNPRIHNCWLIRLP